jgi:hypothetical protein
MNLTQDLSAFSNTAFPQRVITDPAAKTPAWIRQMAAAGVTEFMRSQSNWHLWAHDTHIGQNIQYAEGEQDTRQYARLITGSGLTHNSLEVTNRDGIYQGPEGEQTTSVSGGGTGPKDPMGLSSIINAKPLPILPVKLRGLKSTVMQQGYEATITALGKKAKKQAEEHEAELRLWVDFGGALKEQGMSPPPSMPDPMPETEAEIRTYLDNWQVGAAAELERKVKICWIESGGAQQMSEVADDILRHGYGCLADFQLPGQRPVTKRIMPHRGMFLPSAFPDYRDMSMGGYWEVLNLDDVLSESANNRRTCNAAGTNWTKEDRDRLRQLAQSTLPDTMTANDPLTGAMASGTGTVTVIRWYFRTDDLWGQESYRDESGATKKKKVGHDQEEPSKEGGKITRKLLNCLYEATLICGLDLAYNCQKVYDQGRDLHDPSKARMPFSIFVAGLVQGHPVSVTRNAKGIIDEIERSFRAYLAVKRTYTPDGVNVPPDLLEKMAEAMKIGGKNPAMAAYEYIKLTGDSFFPNIDPDTNMPVVSPITANPFGVPEAAAQHLADVFQQMQLLEMVTGANAVVSAATPTGDAMGKGVNQIALQGAANVMSYLRDGLKLIYESHARNLAGRIWLTEKDVPVTGVVSDLDGTKRQVKPVPDLYEYEFFMQVDLGPTVEEKAAFKQNAFAATQGGPAAQITMADYMQICWLVEGNLKTAQRYMAVAVDRKARRDEAKALNLQKANAEGNATAGQAVEEARQKTIQMEHQLRMSELQFTRETAWGGIDRQVQGQDRNSERMADSRVQVATIAEAGDVERTNATHQHEKENTVLTAALQPPPAAPASAAQ